jgi:NAD(P) transhydrogenase subunit beta
MLDINLESTIPFFYILSTIFFILGIKFLGSPKTARKGNLYAATAMFIAVTATLTNNGILSYQLIISGILVGTVLGSILAKTVKMTAMPQLVAAFNGFGGGASSFIAISEYLRIENATSGNIPIEISASIMLSTFIGMITFSGSLIAFGKLQEIIPSRSLRLPLQNLITSLIMISILIISIYLTGFEQSPNLYLILIGISLLLGILLVTPIGGADMPVVISLLNSYSGLAAAAAGFVIGNTILIVAGALVGAAGIILTQIMTKAMHRNIFNVIFGTFGANQSTKSSLPGTDAEERTVNEGEVEDIAMMLAYAKSIIFIPGYGLAVAQAQHQIREIADLLEERGVEIKYAIHPVAGRMPGHMNVLLAEADIPYTKLYDLDDINDSFPTTDVAVVIGANDVTNPAARDEPSSPIYGMPILDVDKARNVIVIKRSLSPGFAGIDNDLFYASNTTMLFGDAKAAASEIVTAIQEI